MGATIDKAPAAAENFSNLKGKAKLNKLQYFAKLMAKWEQEAAAKQIVWGVPNATTNYVVHDPNDYEQLQGAHLEGSQGPDHVQFYTRE